MYWWEGSAEGELSPSPKSQSKATTAPSGSVDPAELKAIVIGTSPPFGVAEPLATGQWLPPAPNSSYPIR